MATKQFAVIRDITVRLGEGTAHDEQHLLIGQGTEFRYRPYLRFGEDWTGVGQIISAHLVLRNGPGAHWSNGASPRVRVRMLGASITEDEGLTAGEDDYGAPVQDPLALASPSMVKTLDNDIDAENTIDITPIIEEWAPNYVRRRNGSPGGGRTPFGIRLTADSETDQSRRLEVWSRHAPLEAARPYILLTYDTPPEAPNAPEDLTPDGALVAPEDFTGTFSDNNVLSKMAQVEITLYESGGLTPVWTSIVTVSESQRTSGVFEVPPPDLLTHGVSYEWTARTKDDSGRWGDVSQRVSFIVGNTNPVVTLLFPAGSLTSLKLVNFSGVFSDADAGDSFARLQIQLRPDTPPGDPSWETGGNLWDTGWVETTALEILRFRRRYGGSALLAGDYTWRARVEDEHGGVSDWAYNDITLTQDYDPDPGSGEFLTGVDAPGRTRVVLYGMDETTRGPTGDPVAMFEDAANIGAAKYMNAPGEFYMTLPATHPQVSEVEPWRRHYAVEVWNGDRYVPRFFGLITDFDATDDDVVVYGIDYVALLDLVVDTRYDFDAPDQPHDAGGSKYVEQEVTTIIDDLLEYARAKTNSPVNFIEVGSLASFSEEVTIYSTYASLLSFITGLVQSHRQGSGKSSQIDVRRTNAGDFQFRLFDDPGIERDNLRMEYGGLVQGFRLIAFGDFATVLHGVGRVHNGLKVFARTATTPGIPLSGADGYGRIERVRMWEGVTDANDLARRARQASAEHGRIGKRIALGLRVDSVMPLEGYAIGDYIPVHIQRGVVNTEAYGSGYWTVVGCEWRVYPDGHTENTFVVLPREDGVAPDPDLIPADEILGGREWQVDSGVPSLISATGLLYTDRDTGVTYGRESDGTYTPIPGLNIQAEFTLEDYVGSTVAGPTGFSGSWRAFFESGGVFNAEFGDGPAGALVTSEVSGADDDTDYRNSLSALLPFWIIERIDTGTTLAVVASTGTPSGKAIEYVRTSGGSTLIGALYQDVPVLEESVVGVRAMVGGAQNGPFSAIEGAYFTGDARYLRFRLAFHYDGANTDIELTVQRRDLTHNDIDPEEVVASTSIIGSADAFLASVAIIRAAQVISDASGLDDGIVGQQMTLRAAYLNLFGDTNPVVLNLDNNIALKYVSGSPGGAMGEVLELSADEITAAELHSVGEVWIGPTFLNSWVNFGGGQSILAYRLDALGFVHLKGTIKDGTVGSPAFQLPPGYRPAEALIYPVFSNGTIGRMDIGTNGNVTPTSPSNNASVTLNGITFKAGG